jgi:deoxycytidylate deaminase
MPWFPCSKCAQSISSSGIKKIIGHKAMIKKGNSDYFKFEVSYEILKKGKVDMLMYDGKISNVYERDLASLNMLHPKHI